MSDLMDMAEDDYMPASSLPALLSGDKRLSVEELAAGGIGMTAIAPYYADFMPQVLGDSAANARFSFDAGELQIAYSAIGFDFVMRADSTGACTTRIVNGKPAYSTPFVPWHTTIDNKMYHMWVAFAVMAGHLDGDFVIC